ncbi:helix-turn-helix transcriptional regulator [Streptomyces sp. RFCAC02]|uniref:helix-turn-helix domain-containing protein n=1 Tax=Streptomyces sp. RFCAC02 TaxID=2499143 RepID=UPI001021B786|nr:helix-turn-helix transcriptional regulator [Streptomyces sp. RFCAC02]
MGIGDRIRKRREELGWTQEKVAKETCRAAGVAANTLGRQEIYRYEKGKRTPREWLPAIAEALGLEQEELTAPEELPGIDVSGIWLSRYTYSSTRKGEVSREHFVVVQQQGSRISMESLPLSNDSPVSLDLTVKGPVITGNWVEQTAVDGYYQGAVYHGAIQMLADLTGRRLAGKWVGFTRDFTVDTGPWEMTFQERSTSPSTRQQYDRPPGA